MENKLSILMVAAEAHPLAKVGGLADVLGALPKALCDLGHDVRIAMPYYRSIKERKIGVEKIRGLDKLDVVLGGIKQRATLRRTHLPRSTVSVYLIGNDQLFGREGIYTDPRTGKDFDDNAERFLFFSRAALELVDATGWRPDVIHCHDYQAGFIPVWIRTSLAERGAFRDLGTVFTIHNLAYQGVYPTEVGRKAGLGEDLMRPMGPLEFYGNINMMKAGITFADTITTVSPTYAREIQTAEFGHGLEGVLKSRSSDVIGILNGADYSVWNPATDSLIPCQYTSRDLDGKVKCKQHLIGRLGLAADAGTPLAGIVSRMVDQKGFDIVMESMDAMMGLGLGLVVLGTGDKKYHEALCTYAKRFAGRISVTIGFDEEMAHLIEAGCDMFLMPSKYEPCGLNQMYSMMYGTVPVVRRTGGLADSVRDFDEYGDSTGFVFGEYHARALIATLERAVRAFAKKDQWTNLMLRAMAEDFSWQRSAIAYSEVYAATLTRKRVVSAS